MPETAVDENGEFFGDKGDIWADRGIADRGSRIADLR